MRRRVLALLEVGDALPSGFIRSLIYRDLFARHGYIVDYRTRQSPRLFRLVQTPPDWLPWLLYRAVRAAVRVFAPILVAVRERRIVRTARNYDIVFMSKVTSLALVRAIRRRTAARIVLDFGDALWLAGEGQEQFDSVLEELDAVTTDNELTAAYVRDRHKTCAVIPDCPQVEQFDGRRDQVRREPGSPKIIGWVVGAGTTYNLFVVWEVLERVFARHSNLHLRLLGADRAGLPPFERVSWSLKARYSQQEMIDEVLKMDIGLFPLQDTQRSQVRGVLKATVYMAGGACVVASPVGQTPELIEPDRTGLLARTTDEWEAALERLLCESATRERLAANGLDVVRRHFTVEKAFERLIRVLDPPPATEEPSRCDS